VEYLAAIRPLLEKVPQHRGMTNAYLNGRTEFEPRILAKRAEIDQALASLGTLDEQLGEALDTHARLADIRERWQALKQVAFMASGGYFLPGPGFKAG